MDKEDIALNQQTDLLSNPMEIHACYQEILISITIMIRIIFAVSYQTLI